MSDMMVMLAAPFAACLVLTGIHCYLGLHVVSRGVIFVDLALAQVAALGGAVAVLAGFEPASAAAYGFSLGFTVVGAGLFALGRFRDDVIPQEAVIGIVYAASSAVAVLLLDRSPHGGEAIRAMLVGSVLYVSWADVVKTAVLYAAVGAVHWFLRRPFFLISTDLPEARRRGLSVRGWDFLFYATFGVVVTSSVRIGGILLVFSYLVVPAAMAMLFCRGIAARLFLGWGIGFVVSAAGVALSAWLDLPTGAAVVATFGAAMMLAAGGRAAWRR
ncbi:MAG: iron chelate uptake ABC transporter family permease subunit [Planctomycetota bacterium]